jgi:hypothetical protein
MLMLPSDYVHVEKARRRAPSVVSGQQRQAPAPAPAQVLLQRRRRQLVLRDHPPHPPALAHWQDWLLLDLPPLTLILALRGQVLDQSKAAN